MDFFSLLFPSFLDCKEQQTPTKPTPAMSAAAVAIQTDGGGGSGGGDSDGGDAIEEDAQNPENENVSQGTGREWRGCASDNCSYGS